MSRSHGEPVDLAALRAEYADGGLDVGDPADDPFSMFRRWLGEAMDAGLHEPNAMVLSTVGDDARPSSRMVLLKGLDERGFVLFTNHTSRKADDPAANPQCALLFPWHPLERQVRIEGTASVLEREAVEAYHRSRPRPAQLGAWASLQSRPVASREELNAAYDEMVRRFEGRDVPVPDHWGGYRVEPETVEFWQGRPGRMHDRLVYERDGAGWRIQRLAP
ncbi:pyridoxamine 5'-phosphate oxidase [Nocardioides sp. B-3]|uniref:pyridoxamine 5'-phosphate oxidase n=1 Tax=Nocardioides sp. B-3 TaxID=2895565 RepID=UPI00215244D3|nr:pyridoxamine 5'-phosphate oxidase [Nocardioides sp. B-3]UUZ60632.1 pyridoxamine 5'-phosphate oxidase [Nocardioides sp. B-3]